jgi:hypothetical protein
VASDGDEGQEREHRGDGEGGPHRFMPRPIGVGRMRPTTASRLAGRAALLPRRCLPPASHLRLYHMPPSPRGRERENRLQEERRKPHERKKMRKEKEVRGQGKKKKIGEKEINCLLFINCVLKIIVIKLLLGNWT